MALSTDCGVSGAGHAGAIQEAVSREDRDHFQSAAKDGEIVSDYDMLAVLVLDCEAIATVSLCVVFRPVGERAFSGEKKFVASMAVPALKKSDRQPPVEKRRATRKKAVVAVPEA